MADTLVILCPGQGAQSVGMSRAWAEASAEAKAVLDESKNDGRVAEVQKIMLIAFGAGFTRVSSLWQL